MNNDGDASDDNGHGTWVSGIIAANANDGIGIAGISWQDLILPVKIMGANGTGDTSDLTAGIVWATDQGANVINMSVGGFPYSQFVHDAVRYAWNHGVVLVGAAGNNAVSGPFYPASYPEVISVSATQVDDEFTHWSNYGADVDVSAPGASILTTNCAVCKPIEQDLTGDHRYTYISGTSFAAPNVPGVVALILARYPTMSNGEIVNRLKTTADDLGYPGWDARYGVGRVNALRAVGGESPLIALGGHDALEGNDTLAAPRPIALGTTVRPNIYPAGDVDVFAVDAPRAGRVEISVGPVLDSRAWPWNKSSLAIDPVLNVYDANGTHLVTVDDDNPAVTDRASIQMNAAGRLLVRIHNYTPNGNRGTYPLTTAFIDNIAPTVALALAPTARAAYDGPVVATFSEPVTGVSGSTFQLRRGGVLVPASVSYDPTTQRATLWPTAVLAGDAVYQASLTSGIVDHAGAPLAPLSWQFTTGKALPRVFGPDRYATAAALSASTFGPGVPVVHVATGAAFPDALSGAPAARIAGGPLLLVGPTSVPAASAAELTRLRPGRIVVLGGPGAVSDGVLEALRGYTTGTVTRLAGTDRYATAAAISASTFPSGAEHRLHRNRPHSADALAAGAEAARQRAPILLTSTNELPAATAQELAASTPASSWSWAAPAQSPMPSWRSCGATRAGSTASPARTDSNGRGAEPGHPRGQLGLDGLHRNRGLPSRRSVSGAGGRDAVCPSPLVRPNAVPAVVADELRRLDPTNVVFVGGSGAISDGVREAVRALWP